MSKPTSIRTLKRGSKRKQQHGPGLGRVRGLALMKRAQVEIPTHLEGGNDQAPKRVVCYNPVCQWETNLADLKLIRTNLQMAETPFETCPKCQEATLHSD